VVALHALGSQTAVGQNPAAQIRFELLDDEVWQRRAGLAHDLGFETSPVLLHELIEACPLGLVAFIGELFGNFLRHGSLRLCKLATLCSGAGVS
jgi:hypothetical protein